MPRAYTTLERAGIAIVAIRLPVQILHGVAHSALQIHMAPWQNIYILLVITVLPLMSAFLLWSRRTHPLPRGGTDFITSRLAFLLLFISMFGSLIFGGYYHFLAAGPDNVGELGHHAWTFPFQLSAVLLAVLEAAGATIGAVGLVANRR